MSHAHQNMYAKVLTFYSTKSGVGRSMALANVAWILASNGKRVLIVDWDFNNPDVYKYFIPFIPDNKLYSSSGLIDFVWEHSLARRRQQQRISKDYISTLPIPMDVHSLFYGEGRLDIISAGRQGRIFSVRLRYFNWSQFYDQFNGAEILNELFEHMINEYDFILVDYQAGRIGSPYQFPFARTYCLIACFTLDNHDIRTTANVINSIDRQIGTHLRIYPVPMRVELAEKERLDSLREMARESFGLHPANLPDRERSRYLAEVEILEAPYYRFTQALSTIADRPGGHNSLLATYERLTTYLTDASINKTMELPEDRRQELLMLYKNARVGDTGRQPEMSISPYKGERDFGFVSYARDDVDKVIPIVQDITDLDYHLWWDEGIPGAVEWLKHLEEKIKQSSYVLLFVSHVAIGSKYVKAEIEAAHKCAKPILAIRLDFASLPQWFREMVGKYQMLDVSAETFEQRLGEALGLLHTNQS